MHLLDASEQGLSPDYTIADAAKGRESRTCSSLAQDTLSWRYQSNPAILPRNWLTSCRVEQLRLILTDKNSLQEMHKAKLQGRGHTLSTKLTSARRAELQALELAHDVKILMQWLNHDILALAGPDLEERQELFDFISKPKSFSPKSDR